MANEILIVEDTPIVWADVTDYSGDGGTRTHQLDLTGVTNGAARQGAKAEIADAVSHKRARQFCVEMCVEFAAAPTSGETVELYWGASCDDDAATANPAQLTGADAAYTGTAGDSLEDSLKQLILIGVLVLTADATTQVQRGHWLFTPPTNYGMPVVYVNTAAADLFTDAVEMYVRMVPLIDEVQ